MAVSSQSSDEVADGEPRWVAVEVVVARALENKAGIAHEPPWHHAGVEANAVVVTRGELDSTPMQRMSMHVRRRVRCGAQDQVAVSTFGQREVVVTEDTRDRLERVDDACFEVVDRQLVDVGSRSSEEPDCRKLAGAQERRAVGHTDPVAMPVEIRFAEKEARAVPGPAARKLAQPLQHPLHHRRIATRAHRCRERPRSTVLVRSQLNSCSHLRGDRTPTPREVRIHMRLAVVNTLVTAAA